MVTSLDRHGVKENVKKVLSVKIGCRSHKQVDEEKLWELTKSGS